MNATAERLPDDAISDEQAQSAIARAWERGLLSWKLDSHQIEVYDLFEEWNARRQRPEYEAMVEAVGATLDSVWVEEIARRFGKSAKWIVRLTEAAIRLPELTGEPAVLTYATAAQKSIGQIIVPLANKMLADGPEHLRPHYQGTRGPHHEGLYFHNGSMIKLVGIDEHPDALRGQYSDGVVISEAAFVKGLEDTVRSVLLPQFQRRPWAFLALESSTARQPDHDFNRVFRADAKLRNAYVTRTIDDNKAIDPREKAKAIREAGGRGHPTCEREYYCVETRDPDQMVVPEFDDLRHVCESTMPPYCYGYVAADPGSRDLFGLVFGYYDFARAKLVIQRSWARRNASTRQVACVVAYFEWLLWGRQPGVKLSSVPLRNDGLRDGWVELLRGTATADECAELHRLASLSADERALQKWDAGLPPDGCSTYWDGRRFKQNPHSRVTDVDLRFVQDLSAEYGLIFDATAKDDADAQRNNLRDAIGSGKVEFHPEAGPVIEHIRNAIWNKKRTDYERHSVYGHFDCIGKGTLVAAEHGDVPIERIEAGDRVWTRAGLRKVTASWRVGRRATLRVEAGEHSLVGTADHRVWTENDGWKQLADLTTSDILCTWVSADPGSSSSSTAEPTVATPRRERKSTATTSPPTKGSTFTARCGSFIAERFRRVWTSITRTKTRSTTTSRISSWWSTASIAASTWVQRCSRSFERTSNALRLPRLHGIALTPASVGTSSAPLSAADLNHEGTETLAYGASKSLRPRIEWQNFAEHLVKVEPGTQPAIRWSIGPASIAERSLSPTNTARPKTALAAVQRISAGQTVDVYDLSVEGAHEFFANGVLVHNCLPALIYLWRNVLRERNPSPPDWIGLRADAHHIPPGAKVLHTKEAKALEKAFGAGAANDNARRMVRRQNSGWRR